MRMRAGVLLVLLACLAAAAFAARVRYEMADFEVYWTTGRRASAAEPLYRTTDGHYQFKYFPAFAFVFAPVAALPLPMAKAVWFLASVAALMGLLGLSVRALPARAVPSYLIVTATMLTLAKFYAHELTLGQVNLLLGIVVMGALVQLQRGRETAAGAAFGAAAIVKPYALLFLPYLLATKRFRAAAAAVIVAAAALLLPALQYGVQGNADLLSLWWQTVWESTPALLTNPDNVSIAGMYAKWVGPGFTADRLTVATNLLLLGFTSWVISRRRFSYDPEYLDVALLLIVAVLISPQRWDYVLLLSPPAIMLIVNALPRPGRGLQVTTVACLAVIGLLIYDVLGRTLYSRFRALSVITVVYCVLIGVLAYLRVRRIA